MKNTLLLAVCVTAAAISAACFGFERKSNPNGPTTGGIGTLMGNWSSSSLIPSPSSCTDFKWNVTEQTGTSAKGSFSATCANDLKLTGTAEGTLSGSTITWKASGIANAPGAPANCAIELSGTADILVDSVRIPYSGKTCLGAVSGVETLRRR
jgi:hypothetical protein